MGWPNVSFDDVVIALTHIKYGVVQYIIRNVKVIAKTLTISQATQAIKTVVIFPFSVLLQSDLVTGLERF
jgi:hypothetical protein